MKWTDEQYDAIIKDNTSIIVSAGAGSGKTAVLTERVIRKIKDGVNINELLILTFTNKAAAEMRERIRKSLKKYPEYSNQLNLLNEAYITTFDSFALSIIKKYHNVLNLSTDISIADSSLIYLEKIKIIEEIFENLYKENNHKFIKLITDFCIKDDKDLKTAILKIATKIDAFPNREEYIDNYINKYFSEKYIEDCISEYELLLKNKIQEIDKLSYKLSTYTDGSFKPYNNIIRAELYAMIYRAMDLSLDNEKALFVPKEYKKDATWETGYIAGLARLRMLEEMDETDADEYATRAEVASMLMRFCKAN